MNTAQKGQIGLGKVIADLVGKGYTLFFPMSEHASIDLVVSDNKSKLVRLQIKYREANEGVVDVSFDSVVKGKRVRINLDGIDGFDIYNLNVDKVFYFHKNDIDLEKTRFLFRVIEKEKKIVTSLDVCDSKFEDESRLWRAGEDW